ncbi:SDR family oxidoreductase [Sphingobium sp. V4]|uniref:SDR family NAD(P)-dependent oxidoreductase n=1 Tax=Sphingobium sp. V4 TaxID=3038927 RepID=UPI002557EC88|nr:SDR family oxidoreductase [Sphingobium sp. V4]WIW89445.1 SDR family oxidoreductase [Sphingobium sp. V4]
MDGRKALITGAASGIGRAVARLFAEQGAALVLLDRHGDALHAVAGETGASALVLDLADISAIDLAVEDAAKVMGGIDCVVNCAGISHIGPISDVDRSTYKRLMTINLTAPFFLCRAAIPYLLQRKGSTIVNIASGAGLVPHVRNNTLYSTSKGGLVLMSKALATELAPNVRVNVVCPGVTHTAMTEGILAGADGGSFLRHYPMQRAADAEEIAQAVLFLASDASSYVNGTAMAVDGGRCLH